MTTEDGSEPENEDTELPDNPVPRWVRAAAAGDTKAWEQLVDRYTSLLWSISRTYRLSVEDSADVVQLTWLRLLENLDRIRDPRRLAGWLATTCRRECLVVLERSRYLIAFETERMDRMLGGDPPADERVLTIEQYATLWEAFHLLSEWCQRVLRALVVDPEHGRPSYSLVASALQVPVGSLGPTRARCLSKLRKLLDKGGI